MIPQTFPKASLLEDRAEIDLGLARVLESGWYILGPEVEAFEAEFARYCGVAHGVGAANGTDAIELALRALGIGPGDVVATPSHTAVATVAALFAAGARPLWIDIDPASYLLDLDHLEAQVAAFRQGSGGDRLKAVVAVHLYGAMVSPEGLLAVCQRHGLLLVEDCAQAHGALWNGQRAGSFGDASAFSFYPTKNLGALGDGGMVVTADAAVAERAAFLRQYGWKERYVSFEVGINSRLDPMQAAILRVFLKRLDERNEKRRALADLYSRNLADVSEVVLPVTPAQGTAVYHQYVIRVPDRNALADFLKAHGVGTAVHYPVPVHRQPAYLDFARDADLPHTDAVAGHILSLPMYPQLSPDDATRVTDLVKAFFSRSP
ncbi:erythromycin biosynthesis sensory transduction protein eryC1 [Rhodospirillum rubrum]|uniref:DegT/DnrJ/EryC1/StrS family aminotransferase n=1 Tax=Rhodospirillum rubrum TaxID=1085 RepID=UPI001904C0FF|nr:DegT/DnrJ/EryC1/StrS family aminotransferase [Rhodospirillum rubrum]MBK1665771.1 erythromycin biosynthesis sensory transduction protein eryC1 [Rhodospirillum rubrum]MBK1677854.1 erythromycin biosynthesis sensory transduction protein eryC1 [Rhodospirillum rubrum]